MSVNIGSLVGTLKVIDEASGVIGKVQGAVGSVTGMMSKMGGVMGDIGNVIGSAFSGFATGGPAGAALAGGTALIGAATEAIQGCIKEATASEAVWASLGAAVERAGGSWQTLKKGTEDALLSMSKVTTYSDEQLAQALEKLMTFGLSYDDAMKALGASIDFAAAKHMDLESAATIVGKAMDGNTGILKRYGVSITTTKEAATFLKDAEDALTTALNTTSQTMDNPAFSNFVQMASDLGVKIQDVNGKLLPMDLITKGLFDKFEKGEVDSQLLITAFQELGSKFDFTKSRATDASTALAVLNEQFGGAAQAQTYAGIQERLKNATGEVAEKIGAMFLPALASLTEGMIPVVDYLGKGIDAIGAWLTEVGKMPEVKAATDAVAQAFQGVWKWIQDVATVAIDILGPAMKELWGAFMELWNALAPIGEALQEIWGIFTEGQGSGNLLKDVLGIVVIAIRSIAVVIKDVAPYIKAFAQAFKDAAEFTFPILIALRDAIGGFVTWLKDTFQGFYTWLVGGSLWQDMWTQMLTIASQMIGQLLGALSSAFFEPMKTAFTNALQTVQNTWQTGWQTVQTTFTTLSQQIGGSINTQLEAWKTSLSTSTSQYAPIATQALTAMQGAVNIGMQLIQGDWQGALTSIQGALSQWGGVATGIMTGIMGQLQGAVSAGVSAIQGMFSGLIASAQGALATIQGLFNQAQSLVNQLAQGIVATTAPATTQFQNLFDQAATGVVGAATDLYNWLVGGSIWPDMFGTMASITEETMAQIETRVLTGFARTVAAAQASLNSLQSIQQQAVSFMSSYTGGGNVSQAFLASQQATAKAATSVAGNMGTVSGGGYTYDIGTIGQALAQTGSWAPATSMNLAGKSFAEYAQALADATEIAAIQSGKIPASMVPAGFGLEQYIPSYQTGEGESRRIARTGLATVHEGEVIGRPSDVNLQNTVNVRVDGQTVAKTVEQRLISQRQLAGA